MGISSLRPLTAHLWMQLRIRLAFWAGRAHCWLVSSSHPPVLPGLMEQDYAQSFHPLACFGVAVPSSQLLTLRLDLCPLLSLLRSLWMASRPSAVSLHPTAWCP